jgi:hypothetical protein
MSDLVDFMYGRKSTDPFENMVISVMAACLYCEQPRLVSVKMKLLPEYIEDIPNALDRKAAALCPCLGDALWENGHPVTHRGSQRKRVREALLALPTAPEYDEKREALRKALAELQPKTTSRK